MGVVYKARQTALKRLVALKMILSGDFASPRGAGRFRTEAEAIARLRHPNIVQIYEIGEERGCPFFSLEFMEGGSLDRHIAGTPQPPRLAADLVAVLARAMHVAHQSGIVHRDLKPANVLLRVQPRPAGGAVDELRSESRGSTRRCRRSPTSAWPSAWTRTASRRTAASSSAPPRTWPPSRPRGGSRRSARRPTSTPWRRSSTSC